MTKDQPRDDALRGEELAVYVISVAAQLAGVHPQTLRIYERKGLLNPSRTAGNTRRYSELDVGRLRRILDLTQGHGINLAGVRVVLDLEDELRRLANELQHTAEILRATREELSGAIDSPSAIIPASASVDLSGLIDALLARLRRPIPMPGPTPHDGDQPR